MDIYLSLTQLYLEMARAVFTGIHHPEKKPIDKIRSDDGISPITGIIFLATSATIIYSYLALEAFANYHLYEIWKTSKIAHTAIENLRQKNPKSVENVVPTYDSFYQKYGQCDRFKDLKSTDLMELGKRIKVICETLGIRKIHDVDPKLWQSFKELLEKARHFLIHPIPDPSEFEDMMKTILLEKELGEYVQIAQKIITHFYTETGHNTSEWVDKNTLFIIQGFEYIYKKDSLRGDEK